MRPLLDDVGLADAQRLRRRLDGVGSVRDAARRAEVLAGIERDLEAARARLAARRLAVPAVSYPDQLPISQARERIAAAIREHQVVIVAGETGSGKTTQLPKICLELGRGVRGMIGHTQPRRLAARTVAERIAEELGTELGEAVGYKVRFTDQVGANTLVKLMTDGILLAEMQRDRMLLRYDTLIIDEAHERSLNIDFILGYLRQLLPRRPDLKVIITSATIDPERFAAHFPPGRRRRRSSRSPGAPTRSRSATARSTRPPPDEDAEPADQIDAICDAVAELSPRGARRHPGLPVRRARDPRHRRRAAASVLPGCATPRSLPLYARLSTAEQHRVFARAHRPPRRAGHQRGRDLADRARHPLRDRPRHRPDLPLQPRGPRCSGCRSSRSRRPRPTSGPAAAAASPTASASGCTREEDFARPAGVHRPGDPAHQPGLGHPADDRARARRHRRLPVRRPAGPARDHATASPCSPSSARSTRRPPSAG